ncbi:8-amino-7-oxononanoate synthase [Rhodococcus sp. X156]|uniref:8-amino-7-oxononanoate synthase n=1 Tax=Rhodococcus sp. X156 TaxID=2499145 RepID=UPI000FDB6877|nr:8-amino-7-oxononanoate synthase [Rhodococcus sp. X156]
MPESLHWLAGHEQARRAAGVRRELRPREADNALLDLASNDYLGLSRDPRVVAGAEAALRTWGAGSTGSRLVTGSTRAHHDLEDDLAAFTGTEAGLVFSSGYTANLAAVTALSGPGTLVVSDAGSHASLVDACRLSRARVQVTAHNDVEQVRAALATRTEERAIVVCDSVSSVDGDLAPLRELHAVCREHRAVLVVDEAHGIGVRGAGGRGLAAEQGVAGEPDVVLTMTLSKSLGSQGGAVLGAAPVVAHLIDNARTFIFDTGLNPAAVGAAAAALAVLRAEPERAARVMVRAGQLAAAAGVPVPTSAVVSVVLGEPAVAYAAAQRCRELGLHVGCFRPPSVPAGTSRLRLTARATLSEDDVDLVRSVLDQVLTSVVPA